MVIEGFKDKDRLDRASNFDVGKARIQFLLDDHGLNEFMKNVMAEPTNAQ